MARDFFKRSIKEIAIKTHEEIFSIFENYNETISIGGYAKKSVRRRIEQT